MDDLQSLEQRIQERLNVLKQKTDSQKDQLHTKMVELEKRIIQFDRIANELMETILKPRMEKLTSMFDNAEVLVNNKDGLSVCTCLFNHTNIFPASVKLTLTVFHDMEVENLLLGYRLDILPVFFKFAGHHEATFPLDHSDQKLMVDWIDEKILEFVDVYTQLAQTDQYQHYLQVIDPVCGMQFRKSVASAEIEYKNQTYFFCSQSCYDDFQSDPQHDITHLKDH